MILAKIKIFVNNGMPKECFENLFIKILSKVQKLKLNTRSLIAPHFFLLFDSRMK
jgi:hypothetical protein